LRQERRTIKETWLFCPRSVSSTRRRKVSGAWRISASVNHQKSGAAAAAWVPQFSAQSLPVQPGGRSLADRISSRPGARAATACASAAVASSL